MADPSVVHVAPKSKHAVVKKFINCLVAAGGSDHSYAAARIAEERAPALPVLPKIFERAAVGGMPLGANDPFGFTPPAGAISTQGDGAVWYDLSRVVMVSRIEK